MRSTVSHEALLQSLPIGGRIWLRAGGTSLWPLVSSGAQLHVERVQASQLRRGHLAVVRWADGTLVAHVVVGIDPVVTATAMGVEDPPGVEVLGRVVAIRQHGVEVPVPSASALLVRWVPRAARLARRLVRLARRRRRQP